MAEKAYTDSEVQAKIEAELPGWTLEEGWLHRYYKTDGWPTTLMLVNTIGYVSEVTNHHPDLIVAWAKVEVRLQTHSAGGITDKDFELAKKIDEVVLWRPKAGSAFGTGTSKKWVSGG